MNKARVNKANSKKQKEAAKKFKLKGKPKAKPKKKVRRKKMVTYTIAVRKNRTGQWKIMPDQVTASDKMLATHIAASRNPNRWVKVLTGLR